VKKLLFQPCDCGNLNFCPYSLTDFADI
jgi:hypothetical protein